jgi:hypothetical protein
MTEMNPLNNNSQSTTSSTVIDVGPFDKDNIDLPKGDLFIILRSIIV